LRGAGFLYYVQTLGQFTPMAKVSLFISLMNDWSAVDTSDRVQYTKCLFSFCSATFMVWQVLYPAGAYKTCPVPHYQSVFGHCQYRFVNCRLFLIWKCLSCKFLSFRSGVGGVSVLLRIWHSVIGWLVPDFSRQHFGLVFWGRIFQLSSLDISTFEDETATLAHNVF
jgi:hypothetical protein